MIETINKCKYILSVIIVCLLFISINVMAEVKLPDIFGDNMVLQQQSEVAVWGWAKPGSMVSVTSSWDNKINKTRAGDNGKWKLKIGTPAAGGPYALIISDVKPLQIKNIPIGEVWLCSGQSNMTMPVKGFPNNPVKGSNEEIVNAKNTKIRLFDVGRSSITEPLDELKGSWKEISPETVANFSATAWFFGKMLQERIDVPVGLITTSWGGSNIEAWMSKDALQSFVDIKIPQKGDSIRIPNQTPTTLYNGMIHPIVGYNIRGCIWYQGESNRSRPQQYPALMEAMVKNWRSLWGIGDFPFYYLQIAPFKYLPNGAKGVSSAFLREAQMKAHKIIPNSAMGILMDVGEANTIHPSDKKSAGTRLAYLALNRTYGVKGFAESGPMFKAIKIIGDMIQVTFDHADNGLTSWSKELKEFEIAGTNKQFYPAKASINAEGVVVSNQNVKEPVAVRYAFKDFVIGDLFNTAGLPASSFRSDNWDI